MAINHHALKQIQAAASGGDVSAQFDLGVMYDNGEGVSLHKAEAAKWYRMAAEQGYDLAQFSLGCMYKNGEGVPQDINEAEYWFSMARSEDELGDEEILEKINLYNHDEAMEMYRMVAERRIIDTLRRVLTAREHLLNTLGEEVMLRLEISHNSNGEAVFENEHLIPALTDAIDDPDIELRSLTLHLLGELGTYAEPVLPKIVLALDDPNFQVQFAAAEAAGDIGEKAIQAVPVLEKWLYQSDQKVRLVALSNIPLIDSSRTDEMLKLLVDIVENDHTYRVSAVFEIGRFGEMALFAVPVLKRLIDNDDALTRLIAAQAIHSITGDLTDANNVAAEMLNDPDEDNRLLAQGHFYQLKSGCGST